MALPQLLPHRALYTAFDVYPSAKGAATHIQHAAQTVFDMAGGGMLYVLGHEHLPRYQREELAHGNFGFYLELLPPLCERS